MPSPISSIRNLGPAMEAAFANVGIDSAEALRDLGADTAYSRLMQAGHKPHFIAYYVLEMGLQGRPWNDCKGQEKARLRARFDQLKEKPMPQISAFDAVLDEIGVVPSGRKAQRS